MGPIEKTKDQEVIFNVTRLSNYTTYYFRVDVSDGIAETVKGKVGTAKTWCGLATQCSGKVTNKVDCTTCDQNRKCT